jgi:uncharacterized protein YjdB
MNKFRPQVLVASIALLGCDVADRPTSFVTKSAEFCALSVGVVPAVATLAVGDTVRLRTQGGEGCEGVLPTSQAAWRWKVSNTAVASVDSMTGLVRATGAGTAAVVGEWVDDRKFTVAMALIVR